jgi:DNA-binding SARP family transcriptional activator/tetratricopeptide (TPR) repeat protein
MVGPRAEPEDVEIALLGALEVRVRGVPLVITAGQQRVVLATLACAAPRPVRADVLIDGLWPERAPATARTVLHNTIRRLRAQLAAAGAGDVIDTRPEGYRLGVPPDHVDAHRFLLLVEQARERAAQDDVAGAGEAYRGALGLWRGDPLPDLAATGLLAPQVEWLVECHLAATEEWADLEIATGHADRALARLPQLAERWPLRESLRARLMLALHAAGRTADALTEYARARDLLVDELGVEPGAALREAHQRVLRPEDGGQVGRRFSVVAPAQLPSTSTEVTGRGRELAILDQAWPWPAGSTPAGGADRGPVACLLTGPGGVGKSTLAVHWARQVAGDFPDGQLFVNLRGFDPQVSPLTTHDALRGFLTALGVAADEVPHELEEAAGLYRSLLATRRVLVVLDNAHDAAQVRPLLPAGPACLGLVTSRHELTSLAVTHRIRPLSLGPLGAGAARDLVAARLGMARTAREPAALDEIIACCGGLPLALAVAVAQLAARPELTFTAFADELREAASPLDVLHLDDPVTDVRAVLSWSVQELADDCATGFRLLGLHPGPEASLASVASLTGLPAPRARSTVRQLVSAHLVLDRGRDRTGFHDLVRAYAAEVADRFVPPATRLDALRRVVDHYLHSAVAATRMHFASPLPFDLDAPAPGVVPETFTEVEEASAWLEREHATLVQVVELAAATPGLHRSAWQLARALNGYLWDRCRWHEMLRMHEAGLRGCLAGGDLPGEADSRHGLGEAYVGFERYDDSRAELDRARRAFVDLGDRTGESDVLCTLGRVLEAQGSYAEAIAPCEAALAIYQEIGDHSGQAIALNNIAWLHARLDDFEASLTRGQEALALYRAAGDQTGQTYALDTLGRAYLGLGDHVSAVSFLAESAELARQMGQHFNQAANLTHLGEVYEAMGDVDAARSSWHSALAILDALEHAQADDLRDRLGRLEVARDRPPAMTTP